MSDLISRQDVLKLVDKGWLISNGNYQKVRKMVESLPSAERKKGKWVDDVAYYDEEGCPCIVTRCNQCGEVSPISRFCPNCGADMREREGER